MTTRTRVPALGAEGWFTPDADEPTLLGQQCTTCGTYAFPKAAYGCPNPACLGTEFHEVPLSRQGTVWSYTDARYQPPPPAKDLLAEFWRLEKEAEKMLEGLAQ